jgi:hypothetical protein
MVLRLGFLDVLCEAAQAEIVIPASAALAVLGRHELGWAATFGAGYHLV